jgi:quinol monooxygenase YgiN
MENSKAYFLKMSGVVPPGKQKEFEQTFKFVLNQLSSDCIKFCLATNIFVANEYHFYSLWPSAASLDAFCKSQEFLVIEGAFKALGSQDQNIRGKNIDTQSFELLFNTNIKT